MKAKSIKVLDFCCYELYNDIVATKGSDEMATKKIGRPTKSPKDYMLRTRLDKETVEKLDYVAEQSQLTRSEIVRKGIEMQYDQLQK